MGARARHGPHHVAQKSTSTGVSDFKTSWSKFASVTSTIPLPAIFVSPRCNVALSADAPCFGNNDRSSRSGDLYRISACPLGRASIIALPFDAGESRKSQKRPAVKIVLLKCRTLEYELYRGLHQTRCCCADHLPEGRAIDIAVHGCRSVELRVVEGVESLETELKRLGFGKRNALQQGDVVVIDPRAVKETALGVAGLPEGLKTEKAGIEKGLAVARIVVQFECARSVLRLIDAVVVHAIRFGSQQGIVAEVVKRDRKTSAETRDPGNRPALYPAVGRTKKVIERQLIVITHHKILLHIKGRQRLAERRIDGIDFFAKIGSLIERLSAGVTAKNLQMAAAMTQGNFERVVIGISDCSLVGVAAKIRAQRPAGSIDRVS